MMVHAGGKEWDAIFVMATPFEAAGVVLLGRFKIQVAALGLRNLMSAWPQHGKLTETSSQTELVITVKNARSP